MALGGSFRNEAIAALTTANRSIFRGCFFPFARNFGCTSTSSVSTLGTIISSGAYTMVLRLVRNRNNMGVLSPRCMGRLIGCYGSGSVLIVISRIRANINEANGLFTRRGCNVLPSLVAITGKLNNKLPVNIYVYNRGLGSIVSPSARNAAFNTGPIIYTNTGCILSAITGSRFLTRIRGGNRCFRSGLAGVSNMGDIHEVKLVVNVRLRGNGTRSVTVGYIRGNLLVVATGSLLHVLPPLIVSCGRVSRTVGVLRGAVGRGGW